MNKKILPAALLTLAFLMALPAIPVMADTQFNTSLSISPGDAGASLGGTFSVNVLVSDVPALCAYDITVSYDTDQLDVTMASLGHTLYDFNNDGLLNDDTNGDSFFDVFVAKADVVELLGKVSFAVALVAIPGVDVRSTKSEPILTIGFMATGIAPSLISIVDDTLVSCRNGPVEWAHTSLDGTFTPAAGGSQLALIDVRCRAVTPGFNIAEQGTVQTVFCNIINRGTASGIARADFSWRSIGGQVSSASSAEMVLAPGQQATLSTDITVQSFFDVFFVTGTLVRVVHGPGGDVVVPMDSEVFKFNVRV